MDDAQAGERVMQVFPLARAVLTVLQEAGLRLLTQHEVGPTHEL